MTVILGIDPGTSGALAFYFPDAPNRIAIEDMPVCDKAVIASDLGRIVRTYAPTHAFVEHVHAMPKNGSLASFSLGSAYGTALGVLAMLDVPVTLVLPRAWKASFKIPGGDAGKEKARATALRLFPASADRFARVKDHNRADAALIARHGADTALRPSTEIAA